MATDTSSGRDRQFGRLYEAYFKRVCFFYLRQGLSSPAAEELTQEAFLSVYKGLEGFRAEASYETWIFRIVRNKLKNYYRHNAAQMRDAPEVPISALQENLEESLRTPRSRPPRSPESSLLSREREQLLYSALSELPPKMREVLTLRLQGDLKYQEIADRLQISIDTVKSHIFQAREKLRHSVGDYFEFDLDSGKQREQTGGDRGSA